MQYFSGDKRRGYPGSAFGQMIYSNLTVIKSHLIGGLRVLSLEVCVLFFQFSKFVCHPILDSSCFRLYSFGVRQSQLTLK